MGKTDNNVPAAGPVLVKAIFMPPCLEKLEAENVGRVIA